MQIVTMALSNLKNNKFKTCLVIFSMMISVSACIIILTFGNSAYPIIINEFSKFGAKKIVIHPYQSKDNTQEKSIIKKILRPEQVNKLRKELGPYFNGITEANMETKEIMINDKKLDANIIYTDSEYFKVNNIKLLNGHLFSELNSTLQQNICIIENHDLIPLYMKHPNYLGQELQIANKKYKIIGMVRSLSPDKENDPSVYLMKHSMLPKSKYISNLQLNMKDIYSVNESIFISNQVLQRITNFENNFEATYMKSFVNTIYKIISKLKLIVLIAACISFLVGGSGISNIMTLSIKERTKEIGILKAIGAGNKIILKQFLIEAMVIGLIGGLAGVFVGLLIPLSISKIFNFSFYISTLPIVLSLSLSILIGIIFGFIPAYRASKLNPIDTLRYD